MHEPLGGLEPHCAHWGYVIQPVVGGVVAVGVAMGGVRDEVTFGGELK